MAPRLLMILACLVSITSARAGPRLLQAADAPPLAAWVGFCNQHPAECTADVVQPEALALTQSVVQLLSSVNRTVNGALKPIRDEDHWGVTDLWSYPTDGSGDCEDYQLLKRKLLIEAGLPRRVLLMTVVIDENGEGHAVLTVRTDRGDFILDNKTDEILEWFETNYIFVKRESSDRPGWAFLTPERDGTVVASAERAGGAAMAAAVYSPTRDTGSQERVRQ
jgi:predicted transglutaminase-like cysteine proteinase